MRSVISAAIFVLIFSIGAFSNNVYVPASYVNEMTFSIELFSNRGVPLEATITRRMSVETIPFWVEYTVDDPEDAAEYQWTLNTPDYPFQYESGRSVSFLPKSNAKDLTPTLRIVIDDISYRWDETIDFPLHSRTEVLLDALQFGVSDPESVSWAAANGDPFDAVTFPIADPNSAVTTLRSEWPNVLNIECEIEKRDGTIVSKSIEALIYFRDGTPFEIRGTAATLFEPSSLIDLPALISQELDVLKRLGMNTIVTAINWWYGYPEDGIFTIQPIHVHPDPRGYTPSLEDLQYYISEAKKAGFAVYVQLLPYSHLDSPSLAGDYHPSGWGNFAGFMRTDGWLYGDGQGLENMLLHYLEFFVENDVDGVFLGAEQGEVEANGGTVSRSFFNKIIAQYREAGFEGQMSYGLNYWHNPSGTMPPMYLENLSPSESGIPWDSMDMLGLTFYPSLATTTDASTEDMYREALRQIDQFLWPFSLGYGKQLFVADCVCYAYDGCAVNPLHSSVAFDFEEQRRWTTALLRAFTDSNQDVRPLFEGIIMCNYRILPDVWIQSMRASVRTAQAKLNDAANGQTLQQLMMVYFCDKPLQQ